MDIPGSILSLIVSTGCPVLLPSLPELDRACFASAQFSALHKTIATTVETSDRLARHYIRQTLIAGFTLRYLTILYKALQCLTILCKAPFIFNCGVASKIQCSAALFLCKTAMAFSNHEENET